MIETLLAYRFGQFWDLLDPSARMRLIFPTVQTLKETAINRAWDQLNYDDKNTILYLVAGKVGYFNMKRRTKIRRKSGGVKI